MSTATYERLRSLRYNKPDTLVEIRLGGEKTSAYGGDIIVYVSLREHDLGTYRFEPLLVTATGMDEHLPMSHSWKERGTMRLELLDAKLNVQENADDKLSDLLTEYSFVGAQVIVRRFFEGCTWADVQNEVIYKGVIVTPPKQTPTKLTCTVSPHKDEQMIPPYRVTHGEFPDADIGAYGKLMPVIVGELRNAGIAGGGLDLDSVGGARSQNIDIRRQAGPISTLLIAGHQCFSVGPWYDIGYVTRTVSPVNGPGPAGSGEAWRDICYVEKGNAYDPQVADTCDVKGLKDWNEVTLLTCPTAQIKRILQLIAGKSAEDFASGFYKDSDWRADGIFDQPITIQQMFTRYMKQLPFLFYHNRQGEYTNKELTHYPVTEYTDVLGKEDIKVTGLEYGEKAHNSVTVNYWKNLGNKQVANAMQPEKYGPWFQCAWITCLKQDSGKTLQVDVNDSTLNLNITPTGTGIDPGQAGYFELVLFDNELLEYHTWSSPTLGVWRRGACGTDPAPHKAGARMIYLRTHSCHGGSYRDQRGGSHRSDDDAICVKEEGSTAVEVSISPFATDFFSDPERLAKKVEDELNAHVGLSGTYTYLWDAERNRMTSTSTANHKIYADGEGEDGETSDYLATVLGHTTALGDLVYATIQAAATPALQREAHAAYAYARYRTNASKVVDADLIRNFSLASNSPSDTAIMCRNFNYDLHWKRMPRFRFETGLDRENLLNGMIFETGVSLDIWSKFHGQSWAGRQWRVVRVRQKKRNRLEFLAEEVLIV